MSLPEKQNIRTAIIEFYKIRPIEQFWSILKLAVYRNDWKAKNRSHLIQRIERCYRAMDLTTIIKMFDHLKEKIHRGNELGLSKLIK